MKALAVAEFTKERKKQLFAQYNQRQLSLNDLAENIRASSELNASDLNQILGNVIQDKVTEVIEDKIDNMGEKLFDKLDEKYKKTWGSKISEHALPVLKIAVTAKTEGAASERTLNLEKISLLWYKKVCYFNQKKGLHL